MTRSILIPTLANSFRRDLEGERRRAAGFIRYRDDDRQPTGVIDDDLEMLIAAAGPMARPGLGSTQRAVAAGGGDPAELLVVLVDECPVAS